MFLIHQIRIVATCCLGKFYLMALRFNITQLPNSKLLEVLLSAVSDILLKILSRPDLSNVLGEILAEGLHVRQ